MIKIHELRIGNLVNSWENGGKGNLAPATLKMLKTLSELPEASEYLAIKPAELTPEILEKAGFAYREHLQDHFIKLDAKVNSIIIIDQYMDAKVCNSNAVPVWLNRIQYLHQLQNLYFALTGSELIINL